MAKNSQKIEWKTQSKIFFDYAWLLHCKIARLDYSFLRMFELFFCKKYLLVRYVLDGPMDEWVSEWVVSERC